jgi:hypothetical protein
MLLEDFNNLQPFKTNTTNMPTPDDILFNDPEYYRERKKVEGFIVWMSPDEYIEYCKSGFGKINPEYVNNVESSRDQNLVNKYAEMMKAGDKFPLVTLDYRRTGYDKNPDFTQEGLHRAMAARKIGVKTMPVGVLKSVGDESVVKNPV